MANELDIFGDYEPDLVSEGTSEVWVILKSSNVSECIYWPEGSVLGVRFHSGEEYWYYGVPLMVYQALIHSESPGRSVWRFLRSPENKYPYRRVRRVGEVKRQLREESRPRKLPWPRRKGGRYSRPAEDNES